MAATFLSMEQGRMGVRSLAKHWAGRAIERANGQLQYRNCIFILAHMRCGSTALSNILCSRPDVNGYGESHVRYDGPGSLGQLALNQMVRAEWSRRADYQFDKVLHCQLDGAVPPEFFEARAIFMVREPEPAITSICHLFQKLGRRAFDNPPAAAAYYLERLEALARLWDRFPAERRIGLTHRGLMNDPELALAQISAQLGFAPPLANAYVSNAASRKGGGGDPLVSGQHHKIESTLLREPQPIESLGLSSQINRLLLDHYADMQDRFATNRPQLAE